MRSKKYRLPSLFVYFIGCQEFVKIGIAGAIETRLSNCQVNNPHPIELLALMRGEAEDEKSIHALFSPYHHRGEWFRNEDKVTALIERIKDLDPIDARLAAGDWYFEQTGYNTLRLDFRQVTAMRDAQSFAANVR